MNKWIRSFILLLFALSTQWVQAQNVAKVGTNEYATIQEAIDAWGPGKTLTLLADVTTTSTVTVEVNATKSTSNWVLQLGNHTWTASGCNAFNLYAAGGTVMNQNYGLKIYANQNGGITASGKYCIECTYDTSTAGYRPRLEIHGGTYDGSNIIYYKSLTFNNTSVSNGPSTHFFKSDGDGTEPVFNGNFALAKCPITINAGYFNGTNFNTYPVGSTADTRLQGGHFKTWSAFPSASNNKGIVYGNYRILVKSNESIDVTNGAPATYEASTTSYTTILTGNRKYNGSSSSYYPGLIYFESANYAIQKYNIPITLNENVVATQNKSISSGTLTIDATAEGSDYTGAITLGNNGKFVIIFPEGGGHYGVTVTSGGNLHVEETVTDGIVTRTYSRIGTVSNPEAKIDDTGYSTVYDAFYAVDGNTENKTIVLQKDVTNAGIITNGKAVNDEGKTVATFDLNGHSIGIGSVGAGNQADYTLTIIDSSEGKTGTVTNSDASLFILGLTGINDYSGTYTLKIQAGTWMFDPSNVTINGVTYNMVDEGYVAHDNGNGTWTVGEKPMVAQIGTQKYETIDAAVAAANEGETIEVIAAGDYKLPNLPKNVTIEGKADGEVSFTHTTAGSIASVPNGATFKNVKFNCGNVNYHGFQHAGTINMEGCTLDGKLFSYGDMNFTDCSFTQSNSDYHMWTYSGNVTYTGCTFTNSVTGKFINVYNESGATKYTVTANNCTFINNGSSNKAALNVKATSGSNLLAYDVIINNCSTEGNFPEASSSDALVVLNSIAQVDDRTASGVDNITVTKDGVLIYPATVAAIGETRYPTLQAAVDAAQQMGGEVTINIIDNISGETVTIQELANFKLTIDGKKDASSNYTVDAVIVVDGLRGNGGSTTNGASVTLQNIAFVKTTATDGIQASHYPHNLTIQDCTYSGFDNDKWFLNASVDGPLYGVTVKNVTVEKGRLIYANMADDAVFENITATNDIKVGFNVKTSGTALIKDCQVTTGKYAFRDYSDAYEGTFTLEGNTFISTSEASDEGVIVNRGGAVGTAHVNVVSGTYTGHLKVMNNKEGVLAISGGYFSEEFPQEYIAEDLVAAGNACVPASDKEGYFTVGIPHYVAQIGETKYVSLQAALDAAHEMTGDVTVELLDNISGYSIVHQKAGVNVTIDGKDKTVAGQILVDGNGRASGTETLTIQNVKFEGDAKDFISGTDAFVLIPSTKEENKPYTTGAYNYAHNVTVKDCSFTSTSSNANGYDVVGVKATSGAGCYNMVITGCTGTNLHSLAQLTGTTGGTVENNTVTAGESFLNVSGGTGEFAVSGNTFTSAEGASGYGVRENGTSSAVITLTGNTFTAANSVVLGKGSNVTAGTIKVESGVYTGAVSKTEAATGKIAISGGYFSEEFPNEYIAEDLVAAGNACVPASDMEGYFTVGIPHYVAQIGETKYVSLADAVNAVSADGTKTTIVMIDDETINTNAGVTIPASKNVILDLNGKTIKGVVQSPTSAQVILNKGTLTITDNSDEKNGTITNEVSDENAGSPMSKNWFSNVVTNNGTLTVNGGNIANTGTGGACYAIDNITNGTSCTPVLNIAGGNISAKKVVVRMFCNSTTNVNTVNITGGVISSENAYALQTQQANSSANKAALSISGGTLSGQYAFCDYGDKNTATQFANASYSITGGFFSGYMWSYATYYCGMEGFVSGGYFDNVVGGDIVAPGKACVDNTEEETKESYPYTIGIADVHYYWLDNNGQIDGGGYYTIYAPFAGPDPVLMDGEFVELQKNITLTQDIEYLEECNFGDPIYKGGTFTLKFGEYEIDLNGHVFPIPTGVTILTDKQTNIFSALEAGYIVLEEARGNGYAYSVIAVPSSSLIVFHDSGTYEKAFEVPIYSRMAAADIYYKVNGGAAQKYSAPVSISADTELEAWLQVGSKKVGESIVRNYAIVAREAGPAVADNYYYIKNNGNGKYVNVAGRKTVTFMDKTDAEKAAGAVVRVKAAEGGAVETLRSQAIDLPGYAKRAMNYVPEMVQLIVSKLHADGGGNILGENGLDAIMNKFNESFDYNLYLEETDGGYRIYGRTPSMKPVVDFYAENKDQVDAKLPELETFINGAIDKLKAKLNGRGSSILKPFSVEAVWEAMGGTLTKPEDAESTSRFYEEVLASEANVWSFAYQTAMMYYEPLMASETFQGLVDQIGDYKKYLDKLPQVHPNFKYYIVADGSKMDFISEGNPDIDTDKAVWTLENRTEFTVAFDANDKLVDGAGTKYYTTLYTDFAYSMPENAKAYAVTSYNDNGIAELEELTDVIPAQTPVLLMTQDEGLEVTLTLSTENGTAPTTNLLKGADWVINEYEMKNEQLQGLFEFVKSNLGDTFYENYVQKFEHLMALNAGTVNNKYFFGLDDGFTSMVDYLRQLGVEEGKLGFWENYDALPANKAFLIEEPSPVLIPLWPDITCDGIINIADVTALIAIVLDDDMYGPDWIYPYYNHSVADIDQNGIVNIADVTTLIGIVLDLEE